VGFTCCVGSGGESEHFSFAKTEGRSESMSDYQWSNNSLQTTADGAFNLTIESLVFKCRSSAVFEVGR
jgi:hypothetical protein